MELIFLIVTQFGGGSHCLNFDKFRDTAPFRNKASFRDTAPFRDTATFRDTVSFCNTYFFKVGQVEVRVQCVSQLIQN